jgi:hypothetical protein
VSSGIDWRDSRLTYLEASTGVVIPRSRPEAFFPCFGLLTGAILLVLFGSRLRRWKWTLTGSVVITVLFGALLGLGTPERKEEV